MWLRKSYARNRVGICNKLLDGIIHGIPVDYVGDRSRARKGRNPKIEPAHAAKVTAVIEADVAAGKKAGPFAQPPFEIFCCSPIGAVPKKNSTKIRVVHNLSHPFNGDSVNASIRKVPVRISSFGDAARAVRRMGKGCFLIKLDVEAAYKQVPVRPSDWHLLGFEWQGSYYYERVLPFGLRSSSRLWDLYAAALRHFIATDLGVSYERVVVHYVDDFLFIVKLEADGADLRDRALSLGKELGVPWAPDKTEGPVTCLTFLGVELDTVAMEARLSAAKLLELQQLISEWGMKSTASIRELQTLQGVLTWACGVVRPGRFFLRRITAQISRLKKIAFVDTSRHQLTGAIRADIAWGTPSSQTGTASRCSTTPSGSSRTRSNSTRTRAVPATAGTIKARGSRGHGARTSSPPRTLAGSASPCHSSSCTHSCTPPPPEDRAGRVARSSSGATASQWCTPSPAATASSPR